MNAAGGESATAFPWDRAIELGLGLLRLSPRDFWGMTPRELARALSFFSRAEEAPGRADLARLMARFPDAAFP